MPQDDLTDDQIDQLPVEQVLPMSAMDLAFRLEQELKQLDYGAYLRCLASLLPELRALEEKYMSGPGGVLVDRAIELVVAAAEGRPVEHAAIQLAGQWDEYLGYPDPEDDEMVETDLPNSLRAAFEEITRELAGSADRYQAAQAVMDAAYRVYEPTDSSGRNVKLLLKFVARAKAARDR